MKFSKERIEEIKNEIKEKMIKNPNLSGLKIAKEMDLDKDAVNRYIRQIRKEATEKINKSIIEDEIGKLEDEFNQVIFELWEIVKGPANHKEKIAAINQIINSKKVLFNIKFDAGVFNRKLGELNIKDKLDEEERKLLNEALQYGTGKPSQDNKEDRE